MFLSRVSKSKALLLSTASSAVNNNQLINVNYLYWRILPSLVSHSTSYIKDELGHQCTISTENGLQNIPLDGYMPCRNLYVEMSSDTSTHCSLSSSSRVESILLPTSDCSVAGNDPNTRDVAIIQNILKSHENISELKSALNQCRLSINEDLVWEVLRRHRSDWKLALSFFNWASSQEGYSHGPRVYNEILDILGRMKQIKIMRQVFDEIPKERAVSFINERTFAILLNRYAGAHKVEEAIEIFYKRKDYGFELDMVAFQTLLMSLCRYKHVEEAESLFLQKQNEFPPVIRSRNIILNGWCVLGSLREAKRFWNDIISSKCKPDLFTYGIFINSLTKAGKLSTAVKLFTAMWKKGCHPDVTICNCIIDALCFKKKIPEALEIFGEMNERGCLPDVATYNSLIKHLCKIRRMVKVYELLDEMEQKGCPPNARTYSYILKTMKKAEEVTDILLRMERSGCKIDSDTYNLVLNLYVGWKNQKGIQSVWAEMERNGLGPDQRSYTIMIHGLHSQGKLDEALEYYSNMRSKGMTPEPRTRLLGPHMYVFLAIQGASLLLTSSSLVARHIVESAFAFQGRGKQLSAWHALGSIYGVDRPEDGVQLDGNAEECLRHLIYVAAANSPKLTSSSLFLIVLQQEPEIRLAAYRLIAGLVARPWCLMEVCSKQEIIIMVTDANVETTKNGMEPRHHCCVAIYKALSVSNMLTDATGVGTAEKWDLDDDSAKPSSNELQKSIHTYGNPYFE